MSADFTFDIPEVVMGQIHGPNRETIVQFIATGNSNFLTEMVKSRDWQERFMVAMLLRQLATQNIVPEILFVLALDPNVSVQRAAIRSLSFATTQQVINFLEDTVMDWEEHFLVRLDAKRALEGTKGRLSLVDLKEEG